MCSANTLPTELYHQTQILGFLKPILWWYNLRGVQFTHFSRVKQRSLQSTGKWTFTTAVQFQNVPSLFYNLRFPIPITPCCHHPPQATTHLSLSIGLLAFTCKRHTFKRHEGTWLYGRPPCWAFIETGRESNQHSFHVFSSQSNMYILREVRCWLLFLLPSPKLAFFYLNFLFTLQPLKNIWPEPL